MAEGQGKNQGAANRNLIIKRLIFIRQISGNSNPTPYKYKAYAAFKIVLTGTVQIVYQSLISLLHLNFFFNISLNKND